MDLDGRAERSCAQDRSLPNDTSAACLGDGAGLKSCAARTRLRGLRDLTPAPSPKQAADVSLTHTLAAFTNG